MYIPFLPVSLCKCQSNDSKNYLHKKENLFFESGRQAIKLVLKEIEFKDMEHILMPPSLCSAILEPFFDSNIEIKFYDLDIDMKLDPKNVMENITDETKAVYVIHYFGVKNDLSELKDFCHEKGIILIEDCALSGYSNDFNSYGDISIFSLWKFHSISDGAILQTNGKIKFSNHKLNQPSDVKRFIYKIKISIKKNIMRGFFPKKVLDFFKSKNINNYHQNVIHDPKIEICRMSKESYLNFLSEDLEEIRDKRRQNFLILLEFCLNNRINTLYKNLNSHDIPYCFPVIVDDPESLSKALLESGIETEISINLPPEDDRFSYISSLAKTCISIPIHQDIDIKMLEYIMENLSQHLDAKAMRVIHGS